MVKISQMHSTTRSEFYDFNYNGRSFQVEYLSRATEFEGKAEPYDNMVRLDEVLRNKYETPLLGNTLLEEGVTKGYQTRVDTFREVVRDLTSGQNLVQIQQWRDLPTGLETVLDSLPVHVRDLLKTEYSDPNVIPYDFGMTSD